MKQKQFYRFILKYNRNHGVLIAPKGTDTRFGVEVLPVENWENMEFTVDKGIYLPFMNSNTTANFVNEELKNLIQEVVPKNYPLDFYPIRVKSEEYGSRIYYLIHFRIIFDVIDKDNSVWIGGGIAKPWIDYEKAKDLDFFNSQARINGIMVSDTMKKMMQKRKLDTGIDFRKVPYV
ncbi:hypothetical protein M2138_001535 [Dysgonomonadaceae bacterium PH5-43]|nr:hypothetical protein [Dysgonomonadaceae bacterium PH5-43]